MEIYFGYDDLEALRREISAFISVCGAENVFTGKKLGTPDTNFVNAVLPIIQADNNACVINQKTVTDTVNNLFGSLAPAAKEALASAITREFSAINGKGSASCTQTQLKNAFIRTVYTLHTAFRGIVSNSGGSSLLFYEGSLSRIDFIAVNILTRLGAGGKIICLDYDGAPFLTDSLFTVKNGRIKERFKIEKAAAPPPAAVDFLRNDGFNMTLGSDIEDNTAQLLYYTERRAKTAADSSAALSVYFSGVADRDKFEMSVNRFYASLKSKNGVFVLDKNFGNPTYEETQAYGSKGYAAKGISEMLGQYETLKGTPFPARVQSAADMLFAQKSNKNNAETVFKIWLSRIGGMFKEKNVMPAIIVWGGVSQKTAGFLQCLEYLPLDIIQFAISGEPPFSPRALCAQTGQPYGEPFAFPFEIKKLSGHKTVAYQAEQEIREVLSGDHTRYYQMKQFAKMNPIILKTTLEEIDIIWKEPAKFRPGFSTADNIVTIPSIFAKITGAPDSIESYAAGIQAKITPETLLINKSPYIAENPDPDALKFMRRIYYNGGIDAEKIIKSAYYKYALFSKETQDVIMQGIIDFVKNEFYVNKRTSFVYDILEILFRLPQNVVQMIHNFSFTEAVPKVILYNAADKPCAAADSIMIMFLKSLGFDALMYIPTGYRVVEEYIDENLFNTINIGQFRFDLADIDITSKKYAVKRSTFKNLFSRKGS